MSLYLLFTIPSFFFFSFTQYYFYHKPKVECTCTQSQLTDLLQKCMVYKLFNFKVLPISAIPRVFGIQAPILCGYAF